LLESDQEKVGLLSKSGFRADNLPKPPGGPERLLRVVFKNRYKLNRLCVVLIGFLAPILTKSVSWVKMVAFALPA
jgi:hypothetical protein